MLGTILGTGINLVANGIGSWLANKRAKQAQKIQDEYYKDAMADLDNEINSNYLDRADSRNALRKVADTNTEAMRQLNTDAIRGGATDEAKVAMASKMNKNIAGAVSDIAAMGEQHKDALKAEKRALDANYAGVKYKRLADTSGINSLLSAVGSAAQSIGNTWDSEGTTATGTTTGDTTSTTSVSTPTVTKVATPTVKTPAVTKVDAGLVDYGNDYYNDKDPRYTKY